MSDDGKGGILPDSFCREPTSGDTDRGPSGAATPPIFPPTVPPFTPPLTPWSSPRSSPSMECSRTSASVLGVALSASSYSSSCLLNAFSTGVGSSGGLTGSETFVLIATFLPTACPPAGGGGASFLAPARPPTGCGVGGSDGAIDMNATRNPGGASSSTRHGR